MKGIYWNNRLNNLVILVLILQLVNKGLIFLTSLKTLGALVPILLHSSYIFKLLFEKFSKMYLDEIRSREES